MAILDSTLMFDNAVALTSSRASTNVIDLSQVRDLGITERPMPILFLMPTLPTASGAATIAVALQTSDDNAAWMTLEQSDVMAKTAFTALTPYGTFRPFLAAGIRRYLQLYYTVATGPLTAGTVTAGLLLDRAGHPYYPKNYVA